MAKFTLSKAPKSLKKFDKYVFEFSLHGRYVLLAIAKWWMQLTVRLRKEGFYCTALRGESDYNISINSDMSISCNCDDVFGRGYLGSLHEHSFQEIFSGPIAMRFRKELAAGRIPILECVKCWELKKTSKLLLQEALENETMLFRRLGVKVSELSVLEGQNNITSYF